MYKTILVTLEATPTDRAIIDHVKALASTMHSRVVLLHVADGWAARQYGPDAVSPEVVQDQNYLEQVRAEFQAVGVAAETELAFGDPSREILRWINRRGCDLVAMGTHGHRFVGDLFLGSASRDVRHRSNVPVLLVKAPGAEPKERK